MRTYWFLVFLCIYVFQTAAQDNFNIIDEKEISEGVVYKKITESSVPWSINLAEIDLSTPGLQIMAVTAFDSLAGNRMTSAMVADLKQKGFNVVAATNADFYEEGGYATNFLVSNGQLVSMAHKGFSTIGFDANNTPYIKRVSFSAKLISKNSEHVLAGVNKERLKDELILYNSFNGRSTRTNKWGSEVSLRLLKMPFVNDTIIAVVEKKQNFKGNMPIENNKFVLSGHDASALYLTDSVFSGDTVKIVISLSGMPQKIEDLLGGFTQLITAGKNSALQSFDKEGNAASRDRFATARHPRTAIGFNREKDKLFLVTVDGRQTASAGMTLPELADYMLKLGCWQALNLDGGGSTTMVINGNVVNVPSDPTGERAVSNALMIIKN